MLVIKVDYGDQQINMRRFWIQMYVKKAIDTGSGKPVHLQTHTRAVASLTRTKFIFYLSEKFF